MAMAPSITADAIGLRLQFSVAADADVDAVKAYLTKFSERTAQGMLNGKATSCLHYDFLWNSDNTKFLSREMYLSSEGVCNHVDNTANLVPGLLALGVLIDNTEVTCSKKHAEDAEFMKKMQGFSATLYFKQ